MKNNLLNYSLDEISEILVKNNFEKYRAKQIWQWVFKNGITNFSEMKNIPKNLITFLEENFSILELEVATTQISEDGTIKWLFRLVDGKEIEAVFIPEESRATLCISSQVGCTLNCHFCHTATQRWQKNLTAAEIVGQVFLAKKLLKDFYKDKKTISNIVFMGMGEPLLNYDNVKKASDLLVSKEALDFHGAK